MIYYYLWMTSNLACNDWDIDEQIKYISSDLTSIRQELISQKQYFKELYICHAEYTNDNRIVINLGEYGTVVLEIRQTDEHGRIM